MASNLVRDVVERHDISERSAPQQRFVGGSSKTGFPAVQHRSKATSAFKRARQDERVQTGLSNSRERREGVPMLRNDAKGSRASEQKPKPAEGWMEDISRSNVEAVARMSEEERGREKEDIIDRFGVGIDDLMKKVREARERRATREATAGRHDAAENKAESTVNSAAGSRPASPRARATRKIRFVEPTEADVHVYESQPSSPKRTFALLPPPPEDSEEHRDISSLGSFKGSMKAQETSEDLPSVSSSENGREPAEEKPPEDEPPEENLLEEEPPEEGTPEDIRRRFFPSEVSPEANPTLAWMLPSSVSSPKSSPVSGSNPPPAQNSDVDSAVSLALEPRYSLSGIRLSSSEINNLPTHLGLHHHASVPSSSSADAPAGYTLSDLLLLARSSVPAQRASILGVLAKILRATREQLRGRGDVPSSFSPPGIREGSYNTAKTGHDVDLDAMRRDVLDAAIDALGEKGGVGQRAVDVLWEAVVGFTQVELEVVDLDDIVRVDFTPASLSHPSSPSASSTPSSKQPLTTPPGWGASSPSSSPILVSLPLLSLLPALTSHLIASPSPLSRTHTQVLDILFVLSHFAHHARTIVSPDTGAGVIGAMMGAHTRSSFGSNVDGDEEIWATPTAVRILQVLACSGRDNALVLTGPADILLRYVTAPLPTMNTAPQSDAPSAFRSPLALLAETLRFYTLLSQYGFYAQVATTAQEHFARIGAWLLSSPQALADSDVTSLSRAYLGLLETWFICATDPHRTTPSHDILWSQVQGWGWGEWTMDFAGLLASTSESQSPNLTQGEHAFDRLWANVCHTTAAWVEGASLNGVKGGQAEKAAALARLTPIFEPECGAWRAVNTAVVSLRAWQLPSFLNVLTMAPWRRLAEAADLVAATLRLALACEFGAEDQRFDLPLRDTREICMWYSGSTSIGGPFDAIFGERNETKAPEYAHAFLRPVSMLLVLQLQHWRRSMDIAVAGTPADDEWIGQALSVLGILLPGDEGYANWIITSLCDSIDPNVVKEVLPSIDTPKELWDKDGMKVLLPFVMHSLRPSATRGVGDDGSQSQPTYIAPISPNPDSIARCSTLNLPSLSHLRYAWNLNDQGLVLPLRNDWPTLPLNHLLRSGTSPVFHALPPSWDASETDVARASLLLARIVQEVGSRGNAGVHSRVCMSRAEAVFACMKVFMLEHGQQQGDSGEEVFRDPFVTQWMGELLEPFTYASGRKGWSSPSITVPRSSLEHVAKAFLGAGTPFYQFYTDFLALYDAISFSHPLFGRLLLPPLSMAYPIDYRKLLFGDFGHVLRTVNVNVQDVLCGDVREYLWPVEHDAHVIGSYLKALMASDVQGFVRWIAVHHVAANIWPEFRGEDTGSQERARKLLSAVMQQGSNEMVREVVFYRQPKDEPWVPPRCFMPGERAWRERRSEWVESVGDPQTKTRLQSLLLD